MQALELKPSNVIVSQDAQARSCDWRAQSRSRGFALSIAERSALVKVFTVKFRCTNRDSSRIRGLAAWVGRVNAQSNLMYIAVGLKWIKRRNSTVIRKVRCPSENACIKIGVYHRVTYPVPVGPRMSALCITVNLTA